MICRRLDSCVTEELAAMPHKECDNKKANCIESSDNRTYVKCEEQNKRYILENTLKRHVISYKMDGGVIVTDASVPEKTDRCDYMYVIDAQEPTAILTELKGKNIVKALKQISNTMVIYKEFFGRFNRVYGRAVVTSSTPDLKAAPAYVNLETMLRARYHGNLKISERSCTEKDTELSR